MKYLTQSKTGKKRKMDIKQVLKEKSKVVAINPTVSVLTLKVNLLLFTTNLKEKAYDHLSVCKKSI
jgi:hypothetical protein